MSVTYKYARPAITADSIIFTRSCEGLKVLLIQRKNDPFKEQWAFPGGFAEVGECLEVTARRELEEETGLKDISLRQLHTFSKPDRDPREHVITVAYYALIHTEGHQLRAASDASDVAWFNIDDLPSLAFDHKEILSFALSRIKE